MLPVWWTAALRAVEDPSQLYGGADSSGHTNRHRAVSITVEPVEAGIDFRSYRLMLLFISYLNAVMDEKVIKEALIYRHMLHIILIKMTDQNTFDIVILSPRETSTFLIIGNFRIKKYMSLRWGEDARTRPGCRTTLLNSPLPNISTNHLPGSSSLPER